MWRSSVELCHRFNDVLEAYYVVGGSKGFVVAEIYFVLGLPDLMVQNLRFEAEIRHVECNLPSYLPGFVQANQVKISAAVGDMKFPCAVLLEDVELWLGPM